MIGALALKAAEWALPHILEAIWGAMSGGDQQGQQQQGQQGQQGGMNPYDTGTQSPFAEWFSGNPERVAHIPQFTQQQAPIFDLLRNLGQGQLQNPYGGFEDIAKQAQSHFEQQIVPSLAERFTSMGQAKLSSPAFASAVGRAGKGLEENLASMKQLYGMQNRNQSLDMLGMALTPQYQNIRLSAQPGMMQSFMPELMKLGGTLGTEAIKSYYSQPAPQPEKKG